MNKRFQVWLPLLFAIVMVWGMVIGYRLQSNMGRSTTAGRINGASAEVLELIKTKYVDKESIDSLNEVAINAILDKLDPHSVYIPAPRVADVNSELRGSLLGIGISYQVFADTVNIMYVVESSPAAKAGLQTGDQILKINDTLIAGRKKSADDIHKLIRDVGTEVTLSLLRNNAPLTVRLKKAMVPIPSVDAAYMAAQGVGYIRLNKFSETTYREFMQSMEKLQKSGAKKLILDLRDNGGGLLEAAVNIADELLEDGRMIVYTEGDKVKRKDYKSTKPGVFEEGALVILMNEMSASASEVLAGALQDNDRGTIVGRRSFGKGLVQEQYQLGNGGALRLTVARYFTPLGRSIQRSYAQGRKLYDEESFVRYHHIDKAYNDSAYTIGKVFTTTRGRKVYGGGGIAPEVFVPFTADSVTGEALKLYNSTTLFSFAYQYYRQNKQRVQMYKTPQAFEANFQLPDAAWASLVSYARKDSILLPPNNATLKEESLDKVKALLARQIWRSEGYYQVENADDPTYIKALQVIGAMK